MCPTLALSHRNYAKQLLEDFIEQTKIFYGDEFLVYNIHSMIHLADEVEEYGSLDECSAFPFENYMQKLKRLVRSGRNLLSQIAKRLSESTSAIPPCVEDAVSVKAPNNAFILGDTSCCEVVNKACYPDEEGNDNYMCQVYERSEALFMSPCDSHIIGVRKASQRWTTMKVLPLHCLKRKVMKIYLGPNKILFMAILHTN